MSNGTSYAPYYAATPYATAAAPGATGSATATPTAVYPALAAPPTAMQYSMPTTVDNGCGQQMLLVGNSGASTGQQTDRPTEVYLFSVADFVGGWGSAVLALLVS